jgi:uncharacterized coiled-coil protein SlyX
LGAERKAVHERDVTELRRRLEELERREGKCQETCSALRIQNDEQAREMASLRAKIESLEYKLRASGAIPASSGPSPAV